MHILFYAIVSLYVVLSFLLLFAFYRTQHSGLLLMSFVYAGTGLFAGWSGLWWPLVAGFVINWLLKLRGYEPQAAPVGGTSGPDEASPARADGDAKGDGKGKAG